MLPSPCSLRSAQCAALIALAAAAGIARVDAPSEPEKRADESRGVRAEFAQSKRSKHAQAHIKLSFAGAEQMGEIFRGVAVWLLFGRDAGGKAALDLEDSAAADVADGSCTPSAPPTRAILRRRSPVSAWHQRAAHSLPYAVGPPPRGGTHRRTAVASFVSGDLTAFPLFLRSVAHLSSVSPDARIARLLLARETLATAFSPSSPALVAKIAAAPLALRGEPLTSPPLPYHCVASFPVRSAESPRRRALTLPS